MPLDPRVLRSSAWLVAEGDDLGGTFTLPAGSTLFDVDTDTNNTGRASAVVNVPVSGSADTMIVPGAQSNNTRRTIVATNNNAALHIGWRDRSWMHPQPQPNGLPTQRTLPTAFVAGLWSFSVTHRVDLTLGFTNFTVTAVVYAVKPDNTTRQLFQATSSNITPVLVDTLVTWSSFSQPEHPLAAGEALQYEFYVRSNNNGVGAGARTLTFTYGQAADSIGNAMRAAPTFLLARQSVSVIDSAPASDTPVSRTTLFPRSPVETTTVTDTAGRALIVQRVNTDTAAAADTLGRVLLAKRGLSETTTVADTAARALAVKRASTETAPATDTLAVSFRGSRQVIETVTTTDTAGRKFVGTRTVTDTAGAADTLGRKVLFVRSLTETAPATDTLGRKALLTRGATETAAAADTIGRVLTYVRKITDNIGPEGGQVTPPPAQRLVLVDGRPALKLGGPIFTSL